MGGLVNLGVGSSGVSVGVTLGPVTTSIGIETNVPDTETNEPPVETPDPDVETPEVPGVETNSYVVAPDILRNLKRRGATVVVGRVVDPDVVTRGQRGEIEGWHGNTAVIEPDSTPISVHMPVFRMQGDPPIRR